MYEYIQMQFSYSKIKQIVKPTQSIVNAIWKSFSFRSISVNSDRVVGGGDECL